MSMSFASDFFPAHPEHLARIDLPEQEARPTLGFYSAALRRAGILDLDAVELPGATVMLPFGMRLLRRLQAIVEAHYDAVGLAEFDYPMLVPLSTLDGTRQVLGAEPSLLRVGTTDQIAQGQAPAALTPTGEAVIYSHWRKLVRETGLPIEMYRRARYFRPAPSGSQSGRGLFRAMESGDVFEFHGCYTDAPASREALRRLQLMLTRLVGAFHLPVLWSIRPPWTNNQAVADAVIAADVLLPLGKTAQVAALYDQRDRFSRVYGVMSRSAEGARFAEHVAGYVSRRLIFAHLLCGMRSDGTLRLHPDLAPIQVGIAWRAANEANAPEITCLAESLRALGIRVDIEALGGRDEVAAAQRRARLQGTPVHVVVSPKRFENDHARLVIVRCDTDEETVMFVDGLIEAAPAIITALSSVAKVLTQRPTELLATHMREVGSLDAVASEQAIVVACPLQCTVQAVASVEQRHAGEVLGFARVSEPRRCVISGESVTTLAYLARRV